MKQDVCSYFKAFATNSTSGGLMPSPLIELFIGKDFFMYDYPKKKISIWPSFGGPTTLPYNRGNFVLAGFENAWNVVLTE